MFENCTWSLRAETISKIYYIYIYYIYHYYIILLYYIIIFIILYYCFYKIYHMYIYYIIYIYCNSVAHRVVSILFDSCNQSSFVFFYVVLKSLCRCVKTLFTAGKFSSSLLSLRRKFFSGQLQKVSRISNGGTAQVFIPLIRYLQDSFVSSSFLFCFFFKLSFLIFSFVSLCLKLSAT